MTGMARRWTVMCALAAWCAGAVAQKEVKLSFVDGTMPEGREGARMVADGRRSTKWCIDAPQRMPYYVILSAESAVQPGEYSLTTGDDTHSYPDRNPASWMVYGSNDQSRWTLLDERHSCFRMTDLNEQEYYFSLKATEGYRYFKFVFTEMQDDTRIQLSEIRLYSLTPSPSPKGEGSK